MARFSEFLFIGYKLVCCMLRIDKNWNKSNLSPTRNARLYSHAQRDSSILDKSTQFVTKDRVLVLLCAIVRCIIQEKSFGSSLRQWNTESRFIHAYRSCYLEPMRGKMWSLRVLFLVLQDNIANYVIFILENANHLTK